MTIGGVSLEPRLYQGNTNAVNEKTLEINSSEGKTFADVAKDRIDRPAQTATVSAQELFGNVNDTVSGSRQVYEALLARENANTGTTESDARLAEIKIHANVKASDERAERNAFFDTTFLTEKVKSNREFLAGKQVVGTNLDLVQ